MSRRTILAFLAAATLVVPGSPPATAADCATWTDVKGDSSLGHNATAPATNDNALDIVEGAIDSSGGEVTMRLKVADLSATGAGRALPGDRFVMRHIVNGKIVVLTATRDATVKSVGWTVDGAAKTPVPTVTYDVAADTVTATIPFGDYAAATGAAPGDLVRALSIDSRAALTLQSPVGTSSLLWDTSAAPDWYAHRLGTACAPAPADLPVETPAVDCDITVDPKGDGKLQPPVVSAPGVESPENDPDLDITGVAAQTTADELRFTLRIDKLAALPARGNGHTFEVGFTTPGNKVISMDAGELDTATSQVFTGRARVFVGTSDKSANIPARARFDRAKSLVFFAVDRGSLEAIAGEQLPHGTRLSSAYAESKGVIAGLFAPADEAPNTVNAEIGYTVGDYRCFPPPPAVLSALSAATVQYGDQAAVSAKLADASGAALSGKAVRFAVGGDAVTATTDESGVARGKLKTSRTAGTHTMTVSYAGDATASGVSAPTPFKVVVEVTKMTLSVAKSGSKRTVTATLTDDDGTALAGQTVTWLVNGRKVGTAKTDALGRVVLKTAKPTQTVVADYAGVSGKYAKSKATKRV